MGLPSVRSLSITLVLLGSLAAASGCSHACGLGQHARVTVSEGQAGPVQGSGGSAYQDVSLKGATSDPEFNLSNVAFPTEPGGVDAFLVPTTCNKLFDGPYPGATPLCTIHAGPAKPGGVSARVKLAPGTYRVYLQGYSNVSEPVSYLVDVYIWDYSCGGMIQ